MAKSDVNNLLASVLDAVSDLENSTEGFALKLRLDLATLIVKRLKELNWTQTELSNRTGIPAALISRIVHSDQNCRFSTVAKLLHTLSIKPALVAEAGSTPITKFSITRIARIHPMKEAITGYGDMPTKYVKVPKEKLKNICVFDTQSTGSTADRIRLLAGTAQAGAFTQHTYALGGQHSGSGTRRQRRDVFRISRDTGAGRAIRGGKVQRSPGYRDKTG